MQVNEYFDGKVKSIGFENEAGRVTAGVMSPGEYEFSTSEPERMKVVSGQLDVQQPNQSGFESFAAGLEFHVDANVKFRVRVQQPTAYLCYYG